MAQKSEFRIMSRLNVLRAEKRITQEELANHIGITRATVIAIEKGNYNPSLELAFKLSRFFQKEIDEIFLTEEIE